MTDLKKYEVILNGVNYLLDVNGETKNMGFYVTRYVEGKSPEEAKSKAIELIKNLPDLNLMTQNKHDNPPILHLAEMYEIDNFSGIETLEPGFGFYKENE